MARAYQLDGSSRPIDLGDGYAIVAPGLRGTAEIREGRQTGTRGPEMATPALDGALAATGLAELKTVELVARPTPAPTGGAALRSRSGEDALMLSVPDFGTNRGVVLLSVDESGVARWILPAPQQGPGAPPPTMRGSGRGHRFLVSRAVPAASAGGDGSRGLVGVAGKKILKVLIYPLADVLLGPLFEAGYGAWERAKNPYGLRLFSPQDYKRAAPQPGVDPEVWRRAAGGRSLLFIHGTFSTAHGAFSDLPSDLMEALWERYEGRVFAFDHPTVSQDPKQNVAWLLGQMADGLSLDLDVICHSRGGLVARMLAERLDHVEWPRREVRVNRAVLVGVPNAGTALANPAHMTEMLDRYTTAINLIPVRAAQEVLEGIITLVKLLGHGALTGLDGLASMDPEGQFQTWFSTGAPSSATYYAVTADYEPSASGVKAFLANKVMDGIFGKSPNDLVVPTTGVYAPSHPGFPIPSERVLQFPGDAGVTHVSYFREPGTVAKLREWLAG